MSRHHTAVKWTALNKTARKRIAAQLPLPCLECGQPVTNDQPWDAAHITDLAEGGNPHAYTAAHRSCNRSSGGRKGAAIVNKRKAISRW